MLENVELIKGWVLRLTEAKRRLERLGEVNLVAVQEYAEINARYETLEAQRADLDESVRTIRNTIGQLNRTCRERFRDTFERVNALFKEGYPKLVGGGRAQLVLTDEDDMLETGVDIEVQPPGKRLQNLALLSGGEMAMTAIALIFALFQVKPSPFCLLDEVDAPLDEANGARFNNLLREMATLSQFIVITHNKKTMECVDTLYGVTMPTAGVSQLVSVKLD
jgi:chromosome segregation protein